ncbi:MAG: serine/threonine-protein kinase [Phycisphaerae bacterium]
MAYTFRHGDRPLDGITVQRAVGRGGFGEVYYALTDSGKQVALKYLRENPEIELRGISHVMNLKSPHLITIYDVRHNSEGDPFVIMEYVSGPSLRELMLAEPRGLGPQKAAFFVDGMARGLSYLHERGIVHRDLKPANVFYDDGYVKIGDYGLSKHMSVSRHSGQTVSVGTVHYMAPEIGSGSYTQAIDIYAVGVILFELLTGSLPFTGSSMGEILMRHLTDHPDLSGIPEPFANVIARALAKDPKDRYQSANEMADELRQCADVDASIASFDPATLTRGPRHPEALDPERTMTTPPRLPPVPPLDVRERAGRADEMGRRYQEKVDRFSQKLERAAEKLRRKAGGGPRRDPVQTEALRARRAQRFVLVAVAVAVGLGLALVTGNIDRAIVFVLANVAGCAGPLVAYFRVLRWSAWKGGMWNRLAYAGVTAMFMVPAFAVAAEESEPLARMLVALLAVLVLCDWTGRIEAGQRGEVSAGRAVWPAIIGAIAAAILDAGKFSFPAACLCATMSLLTQAGASLWGGTPGVATGTTPPSGPGGRSRRHSLWGRLAVRWRDPAGSRTPVRQGPPPAPPVEVETGPPRSAAVRGWYGVLSTLVVACALGAFFVLVIAPPQCYTHDGEYNWVFGRDREACAGLLFATLAGVAWLPFLLTKTYQQRQRGLWRGTLRPLVVSLGLTLVAGMVSVTAFMELDNEELGGTIFGLVAGGAVTLVALEADGTRPRSHMLQGVFGVLSLLVLVGMVSALVTLISVAPCGDAGAALLFALLGGLAWLPFLLTKTFQQRRRTIWGGTMRMLVVSLGLTLAAGMSSILAYTEMPHGDEQAGAIFGLVVGSVVALVALLAPGRRGGSTVGNQVPPPPPADDEYDMAEDAGWASTSAGPAVAVAEDRVAPPAAEAMEPVEPVIIDASAPSFVGRTVDAGVSFVGKLLLLAGVVLAVSHGALSQWAEERGSGELPPQLLSFIRDGVPGALMLGLVVAGGALLLMARRRGGGAHLLRGCLGCALLLWAVVNALSPEASIAWQGLLQTDWRTIEPKAIVSPALATVVPMLVAVVLLGWPSHRRSNAVVV